MTDYTVGEHYRSSDEALADLMEMMHDQDISTLWCDGSCSGDYDCTDKMRPEKVKQQSIYLPK